MRKLIIQRSFMESCRFPWLLGMENWALEQASYMKTSDRLVFELINSNEEDHFNIFFWVRRKILGVSFLLFVFHFFIFIVCDWFKRPYIFH